MKRSRNRWLQLDADNVGLEVMAESQRGERKFGRCNSMHEAYAVIKEELEEFWDSVKTNDPDPEELLQVAATAQRAMLELCELARHERDERAKALSGLSSRQA